MSKKNDSVDSAAIENEGTQVENVNSGSPAVKNEDGAQTAEGVNSGSAAVENEKPYKVITANSREELEKAFNDLKEKGSVTLTDKDRDALAAQVEKFYTDAAAAEIKLSCGAVGRNGSTGIYSIQISKL